jgi:hypothetical protein
MAENTLVVLSRVTNDMAENVPSKGALFISSPLSANNRSGTNRIVSVGLLTACLMLSTPCHESQYVALKVDA